jgi:CRP-like cAMP-binding protein
MADILLSHKTAIVPPPLKVRARPYARQKDGERPIDNLLSAEQSASLAHIATVFDYRRPGTVIYSEGEDSHFLYAVAKGCVRLSRGSPAGERQILAFMWPGDLVGLAESGRYVNTAETVGAAILFRFPMADLEALMARDPKFDLLLLIKAAHELRQAQRLITILGQHKTDQRLASFLLELVRDGNFYDERRHRLTLPMNRFDIADYLGTSPETVARAFAKLEQEKLIRRDSPRLVDIGDLAGLRRFLRNHARHAKPAGGTR